MNSSRMIFDKDFNPIAKEITLEIEGSGGVLGFENFKNLGMCIDQIKKAKNIEALNQLTGVAQGYLLCCQFSQYIKEEDAKKLEDVIEMVFKNEEKRFRGEEKHERRK